MRWISHQASMLLNGCMKASAGCQKDAALTQTCGMQCYFWPPQDNSINSHAKIYKVRRLRLLQASSGTAKLQQPAAMWEFTSEAGFRSRKGVKTALKPSALMMGKMMQAAQYSSSMPIHRPLHRSRPGQKRPSQTLFLFKPQVVQSAGVGKG